MGNRTAKTDNVTDGETYAFDDANRITARQVGTTATTYSSDANGNSLGHWDANRDRENAWDSQNRLRRAGDGNGMDCAYEYGADGLRRKSTATTDSQSTTITHYGYDGTNVVREWEQNVAGVLQASATYLLGPSGPMYA